MEIDPELQSLEPNSTGVRVLIQIENEFIEEVQDLPLSANATVDLITGSANNAVLIPIEALYEGNPGEYYVYVFVLGRSLNVNLVAMKVYTQFGCLSTVIDS